jgi:hypothetical protein
MSKVPRAAAPHPAFVAFMHAGTTPSDPDVLSELSEDERKAVEVHARLADHRPLTPARHARKTRN